MSDRGEAMRRALDAPWPEEWRPETPGESIIGWFVRVSSASTRFQPLVWILVLQDVDTGVERAVWVVHEALRQKLKKEAPAIGELVGIKYEGVGEPGAGGQAPARYRVMVDRAAGTRVDWDADRPAFMDTPLDDGGAATAPSEPVGAGRLAPASPPSSSGELEAPAGREPSRWDPRDPAAVNDGARGIRCSECLYDQPHHAAGCPNEFGGL